jgi:hypothetical protein
MHVIIKLFYFISAKSILGKSCKDILARDKFAVSGIYWIRPAVNKLFQVHCDMETHGGGWTLVYSIHLYKLQQFSLVKQRRNPPSKLACQWRQCPNLNHSSTQWVISWGCILESLEEHWERVDDQVKHQWLDCLSTKWWKSGHKDTRINELPKYKKRGNSLQCCGTI